MQKRKAADRRSSHTDFRFPFNDSDGKRVRLDRRKSPDRRLVGRIEVEWMESADAAGNPE